MGLEYGAGVRNQFLLERGIVFLNHGSFGATPRAVMAAQRRWQRRMEAEPVRVMTRELRHALPEAGAALARFMGAEPADLVFVENATAGVNAALRSIPLVPGEEVLITGEVYPAVLKTLRHIAGERGARIVEVPLSLPFTDEAAILAAVSARLSRRTRLLVLDLITSRSAAVLPVAALARVARAAGARVLVDAAHGPGQIDLDLPSLGADWIAGNVHKWLFAPKGTGFLWAAPGAQAGLHPTVISHGYGEGFQAEFGWTGTRDPSAWLSVPAAIDFYREHGDGRLRARNRDLAAEAAKILAATLDAEVSAPAAMRAAMASLALPARLGAEPATAAALHDRLLDRHRIEVPVFAHAGRLWLRISAQIYNERADYERLAEAAAREIGT